ncbi:hypothetical protein [Phenylobacterium sp.]|uniref:hypothetical protein n=1 Tax=Phenylobacterium sp. TaxID=1871053 RepID=UPI002CE60698|nr:hypothetical protein [Phenylobacterium sp.]HLZ77439.1 hypothetical protein [Phenylobacterium sp.]
MTTTERFRARRSGRAALPFAALPFSVLGAATLSLGFASPAQAYQLGGFLKGVGDQVTAHMPAQKPAQPAATAPPAGAGPMGLQGQAGTPLHKLGTDAVAVVDSVSGTTAVRQMDYVFAKQSFTLGPKGAVTLSYLSGCNSEVITGGTVTVEPTGSRVVGGKLQTRATPGCRIAKPIILASASEAGATVNRITPFTGANWDERELKSGPPVFKWDKALGAVTIRVKDMEKDGQVIWQATATQDWVAYPAGQAPLPRGEPFKVEAVAGDKVVASALFSINPALDEADTMANRVVPLSAP